MSRDDAWPTLLARRTGLRIYNMALAGYGPGQYQTLTEEALSLKPRTVVVGFYFGNDFFNAFEEVGRGRPAPSGAADLARRAALLEKHEPIVKAARRALDQGDVEKPPPRERQTVRAWVSRHVMLYALAREMRNRLAGPRPILAGSFEEAVAALTPTARRYASVVDGPMWRTILTTRYRHLVLDQQDPRILLGFEVAAEVFEQIGAQCRATGIDLLVVFIPTKESVFWPHIAMPSAHEELAELVTDEAALRERLARRLRAARVEVIDTLPALSGATSAPYFENGDGHPSPAGHAVIADQLAGWLKHRHATSRALTTARRGPRRLG